MRKILLASVATVAFATSASAYDLIHPFYGPSEGKITSTTSYDWSANKINEKGDKDRYHSWGLAEDLAYGIQDNWTAYAGLGMDKSRNRNDRHLSKGKDTTWYLGSSYNIINDGQQFLQVYGGYYQTNAKSRDTYDREQETFRIVDAEVMYGWNLDYFTPYAIVAWSGDINNSEDKNGVWNGFVGAYKKLTDKVGATLGVDYTYATDDSKTKEWDVVAKVGYMLTDKAALELAGYYMLDESVKHARETDKAYGLTASVKFEF